MPESMIHKPSDAEIDAFFKGKVFGSAAQRLLNNDMNASAIRTNSTLRKDEWKHLDEQVVEISRQRLRGVNDLVSRGLVYDLGAEGLGTTVLETETESDLEAAQLNMDGGSPGKKDRVEYSINYLPLPIIHSDFSLSIRVLQASRKLGRTLDATQAQTAAIKVAEKTEEVLFAGASTYTFGGGTIYGYQDYPNRNTVTLVDQWDASGVTGAAILDDVIQMKQASINAKHYGPWILYVPTGYETTLDDDFKANSDLTIRQRILQVAGVEKVEVSDYLTAHNVILVELNPMTVRMIIGMQPTTVEWQTEGGMKFHFKVMSIMVPQIRADKDGNCGVTHLAA